MNLSYSGGKDSLFEALLFDRVCKIKQVVEREQSEEDFYVSYSGGKDSLFEALLFDRVCKIKQVVEREQSEEDFYVSYSGGKDSTVLSELIDEALPGNKIPRVYANTGIEYKAVLDFVKAKAEKDERFVILQPRVPIKDMLETEGYPFKSKWHSRVVDLYQQKGKTKSVKVYLAEEKTKNGAYLKGDHLCPKILRYQFENKMDFKISDKCCDRLKKDILHEYQQQNDRPFPIIGIMPEEGGRRAGAQCLVFKNDKFKAFQPLVPLSKEWEDWYIERNHIELCKLYYPPYNFDRTGCKGCPFNVNIQRELDTLDKYFPAERKQCEYIWGPVYEEYRRIGYRKMRPLEEGRQTSIEEFLKQEEK